MFILRSLNPVRVCVDSMIGDSYTTINRFESPEDFRKLFKEFFGRNHVADFDDSSDDASKHIPGFLIPKKPEHSLDHVVPLWDNYTYYVMTDSGKTFCKL
jgi:hypothetical protein